MIRNHDRKESRLKANRSFGCLMVGMVLLWLVSPGCEVLNMKKDLHKVQQENTQLNQEVQRLTQALAESRNKVLELQTSNSELAIQIEKSSFHEQEIDRTLQGYKALEIDKNLLQKQVAELEAKLTSQQAVIVELEKRLSKKDSPAAEMPPARFKEGDCVKWYGSPYKDLRSMTGLVVRSRADLTYLVRCTETSMPYLYARDGIYEFQENNLDPCK